MIFSFNAVASMSLLVIAVQATEVHQQLASKENKTRMQIVRALGMQGKDAKEHLPLLIDALEREKDIDIRVEIMVSMAKIDNTNAKVINAIIERFHDRDSYVRASALGVAWDGIGIHGMKQYVAFVNDKKNERDYFFGLMAIGLTYENNREKKIPDYVVKCLEKNLFDETFDVRLTASLAFQGIAGKEGTLDRLPTINKAFLEFGGIRSNFTTIYRAYGERSLPFLKKNLEHAD